MSQLLKDLSINQLHRSVKPRIFSCFGDIALAIGEHFEKYLTYAMLMLQSAAEISVQSADQEVEIPEYTNQLRNGIIEAYSGIFQGFKSSPKAALLMPYAGHILQFLESIFQDRDRYGYKSYDGNHFILIFDTTKKTDCFIWIKVSISMVELSCL
jgi:importin subunit beta-1